MQGGFFMPFFQKGKLIMSCEQNDSHTDYRTRQLEENQRRMRYEEQQKKILQNQRKQLTRKERTHRLCKRGGMLESFFYNPEQYTDEEIYDVLKVAFSQSAVIRRIAEIDRSKL